MKKKLAKWAIGGMSSILSGAANSLIAAWVAPDTFNLASTKGWAHMAALGASGAVIAFAHYLIQSPLSSIADDTPPAAAPPAAKIS